MSDESGLLGVDQHHRLPDANDYSKQDAQMLVGQMVKSTSEAGVYGKIRPKQSVPLCPRVERVRRNRDAAQQERRNDCSCLSTKRKNCHPLSPHRYEKSPPGWLAN